MPTIRVSKMSALAQKLPKPAYPDEMPHPDAPDMPAYVPSLLSFARGIEGVER
jgi:hypothetical protein